MSNAIKPPLCLRRHAEDGSDDDEKGPQEAFLAKPQDSFGPLPAMAGRCSVIFVQRMSTAQTEGEAAATSLPGCHYTHEKLLALMRLLNLKLRVAKAVVMATFDHVDGLLSSKARRSVKSTWPWQPRPDGSHMVSMPREEFMALVMEHASKLCALQADDLKVAASLHERERSVFVLLCGTSGCGKSTLASLLGQRFGISTVVSTDSIRNMLKSFTTKKQDPALFASTYDVGDALAGAPGFVGLTEKKRVIKGYKAQCEPIIVQLGRLLSVWAARRESAVVEGVHLSLKYVARLMVAHPCVVPFLVYIKKERKHVERMAVRAKYMALDPSKNKYVEKMGNIRTIQDYLVLSSDKLRIPKVENSKLDGSVDLIHNCVLGLLRRMRKGDVMFDQASRSAKVCLAEFEAVQAQQQKLRANMKELREGLRALGRSGAIPDAAAIIASAPDAAPGRTDAAPASEIASALADRGERSAAAPASPEHRTAAEAVAPLRAELPGHRRELRADSKQASERDVRATCDDAPATSDAEHPASLDLSAVGTDADRRKSAAQSPQAQAAAVAPEDDTSGRSPQRHASESPQQRPSAPPPSAAAEPSPHWPTSHATQHNDSAAPTPPRQQQNAQQRLPPTETSSAADPLACASSARNAPDAAGGPAAASAASEPDVVDEAALARQHASIAFAATRNAPPQPCASTSTHASAEPMCSTPTLAPQRPSAFLPEPLAAAPPTGSPQPALDGEGESGSALDITAAIDPLWLVQGGPSSVPARVDDSGILGDARLTSYSSDDGSSAPLGSRHSEFDDPSEEDDFFGQMLTEVGSLSDSTDLEDDELVQALWRQLCGQHGPFHAVPEPQRTAHLCSAVLAFVRQRQHAGGDAAAAPGDAANMPTSVAAAAPPSDVFETLSALAKQVSRASRGVSPSLAGDSRCTSPLPALPSPLAPPLRAAAAAKPSPFPRSLSVDALSSGKVGDLDALAPSALAPPRAAAPEDSLSLRPPALSTGPPLSGTRAHEQTGFAAAGDVRAECSTDSVDASTHGSDSLEVPAAAWPPLPPPPTPSQRLASRLSALDIPGRDVANPQASPSRTPHPESAKSPPLEALRLQPTAPAADELRRTAALGPRGAAGAPGGRAPSSVPARLAASVHGLPTSLRHSLTAIRRSLRRASWRPDGDGAVEVATAMTAVELLMTRCAQSRNSQLLARVRERGEQSK